jgi:hypothetical protein
MVSSLQQADHATLCVTVCDLTDDFRQVGKIFLFQAQASYGVQGMSVKTSANQDQFGLHAIGQALKTPLKFLKELVASNAEGDWDIQGSAQALARAGFVGRAGSRVERTAVDRQETDSAILIERVLRAVAVMNVPIHDQDALKAFG